MLTVRIPNNYLAERKYIIGLILGEWLGIEHTIEISNKTNTEITETCGGILKIADGLFKTSQPDWLTPKSLPIQPLSIWDIDTRLLDCILVSNRIPLIFSRDLHKFDFLQIENKVIELSLDVFGSAFFMLTRYEEVVKTDRDEHDRFPANASLAYQEDFLTRPIVNEYVEILRSCISRLWPTISFKKHTFVTLASHDVDRPFKFALMSLPKLIRHTLRDILKKHRPIHSLKNISKWLMVKANNIAADPYNTFDLIMNISEKNNLKSTFNFMSHNNPIYTIRHPKLRELLSLVSKRRHEIGLHTSYDTYTNPELTKFEFDELKRLCEEERISQAHWGGRQHVLRWQTPTTFQNLENAGLDYDSTLGFADHAGFRCGTCLEFPVFNLKTHQALKLKERPLTVMDVTLFDSKYMNYDLDEEDYLDMVLTLKNRCRMFGGIFSVLWHNCRLTDERSFEVYQSLIESC